MRGQNKPAQLLNSLEEDLSHGSYSCGPPHQHSNCSYATPDPSASNLYLYQLRDSN